ncbi:hypothetical protein [Halodesulfovibrio spirochaetisodalis]|uniref:Uncharacterized protein n=1 Tax=Halodesulfovibrio spirochaetisodalis TaxID=1560234 RepID=A0A1B7XAU8_9BACT|nr:hypothetical protein [Halodesulfovibrio spirochaetisodalis]OBQ46430.1 hypothetical protein SP90_12490 [Halodesulfovibrio spirochaetisodalis]
MVRAKIIACNIAALVVLVALVLPTAVKAQTVQVTDNVVVVEKIEVLDETQCSSCPPCPVMTVPCNQIAIKKVLREAADCKIVVPRTRPCYTGMPCGTSPCAGRFVPPCGRWWAPKGYMK